MKILIVTDSYPPELRSAAQLMADLAEGLAARGENVTVATTAPAYNLAADTDIAQVPREETSRGVRVVRIITLPHHRVNYLVRGVNQLLLPRIFANAIEKKLVGPFDVVIVHSPPLPLALSASRLAKHYGARFIANVHDIFPQNGIDLVSWWQKPLIQFFFGWMEKRVYSRADEIVVPSENHAKYLEAKRGVSAAKLRVIPHWIDEAPFESAHPSGKFRTQWGLGSKFVFFFGGVIGPSQGLDMVLNAAADFSTASEVMFLFVGDGTDKPRLQKTVLRQHLNNVVFKPFVSQNEYPALVKEMDVCFATLTSKNTTPAVPAKLMGYMAAGVPVVLAVHKESDAIRIVNEARCGFTAVSSDQKAVIAAFRAAYNAGSMLKTLGENGRKYLAEHFEKKKLIAEWDELLHVI